MSRTSTPQAQDTAASAVATKAEARVSFSVHAEASAKGEAKAG